MVLQLLGVLGIELRATASVCCPRAARDLGVGAADAYARRASPDSFCLFEPPLGHLSRNAASVKISYQK